MLKSKIRKKILKLRKSINANNLQLNVVNILNYLNKFNIKNKIIGGYYPVNFEIDDLNILKQLEKKKIKISLPVITGKSDMNFYSWSFNDILILNKYGIPEPEIKQKVYPDIIMVPLVAFDKFKYRLGYGGGFYDRYIQKIKKIKKIATVGLAFSFQEVKDLPKNKYDKKLDFILTENNIK